MTAFRPWLLAGSIGLLMAFVAASTLHSGYALRRWTPVHNLLLSWPDNLLRMGLVGLCLATGYTLGPGTAALGWGTASLVRDVVLGVVAGLSLAVVLNVAGQAAVQRWGPQVYSTRLMQCILPLDGREWIGVLFALLPAAALEELLFRSLPLGGLSDSIPPWWLLWPLALFFGLLHWPQGGWGVAGTALAALTLSGLFLATHSIWAPLTAHYALNVLQVVAAKRMGIKPLRASQTA